MRRGIGCLLTASVVSLAVPQFASAQVRGFTRQQQASLLVYQQQIATQQRLQQQQQLQVLRQSLLAQQQALGQQARVQQRTLDLLIDPNDPNLPPDVRAMRRSGTAVFGEMYYNSAYFNRVGPYYNYQFVSRRNRPTPIGLGNQTGLPTSGYSGIIFGNNFGLVLPY